MVVDVDGDAAAQMRDDKVAVFIPLAVLLGNLPRHSSRVQHMGKRAALDILETRHTGSIGDFIRADRVIDERAAAVLCGNVVREKRGQVRRMVRNGAAAGFHQVFLYQIRAALCKAECAASCRDRH